MKLRESVRNEEEITKIKHNISKVIDKNKEADLFHKAFLKPI